MSMTPEMTEERHQKTSGIRRFALTFLRFAISFGAIGFILYVFRLQLPAVWGHLRDANGGYFIGALLVFFPSLLFVALRLKLVLQVHDIHLRVADTYYVNVIALFFNNVLPSSVGGEMVKAYYIFRHSNGRVASFSAVVVDRLFGLATMVIIGSFAVLIGRQLASPRIISSIAVLAAVTGGIAFVVFNRRVVDTLCSLRVPFVPPLWLDKLKEIYQAIYHYRQHRYIVGGCFLLTVLGQMAFIVTNFLLAKSLAMDIPLAFFFFFVPIIMMLGLAPSVNGIGVREATYLFYLSEFSSSDKALALSLLTTFFMLLVGVMGGIIYAFKGGLPAEKAMDEPRPPAIE